MLFSHNKESLLHKTRGLQAVVLYPADSRRQLWQDTLFYPAGARRQGGDECGGITSLRIVYAKWQEDAIEKL